MNTNSSKKYTDSIDGITITMEDFHALSEKFAKIIEIIEMYVNGKTIDEISHKLRTTPHEVATLIKRAFLLTRINHKVDRLKSTRYPEMNKKEGVARTLQEILEYPFGDDDIEELNLKTRAANGMRRAGIMTITQLMQKKREELMRIPNIGIESVNEIEKNLKIWVDNQSNVKGDAQNENNS